MRQVIPPKDIWFLPALIVRVVLYTFVRLFYPVKIRGADRIPKEGGVLLVANHLSYVDVGLLQVGCPRFLYFVAHDVLFKVWWLGWFLRLMRVEPISSRQPHRAIRQMIRKLERGETVCIFPEGQISRTGNLLRLRPGFEVVAQRSGCPVVPAVIDGIWGSFLSFSENHYGLKRPLSLRHQARLYFGDPVRGAEKEMIPRVRQAMLDLSAKAFADRPTLEGDLGSKIVRSLARAPWRRQLVDWGNGRRAFSRGRLLATSILLAKHLRRRCSGDRIGLAVPPGLEGVTGNVAVLLAGKTPVNLALANGKTCFRLQCERARVETVLATGAASRRLGLSPEERIDLETELDSLGNFRVYLWMVAASLLPGGIVARLAGVPARGGDREAAVLFAEEKPDDPRGVILSHRNLLANVEQMESVNFRRPDTSMLTCLPLSRAFGFTVTFLYPLIEGVPVTMISGPLALVRNTAAFSQGRSVVLCATPRLSRFLVEHTCPADFSSLRTIVLGGGGLANDLRRELENRFGARVLEGYGLTAAGPSVSANLPDPRPTRDGKQQQGNRPGSAGRLLPGISARIFNEDLSEERWDSECGVLLLKGANLSNRCLGEGTQKGAGFVDGWLPTPIRGRFDEEGFFFIEDRMAAPGEMRQRRNRKVRI